MDIKVDDNVSFNYRYFSGRDEEKEDKSYGKVLEIFENNGNTIYKVEIDDDNYFSNTGIRPSEKDSIVWNVKNVFEKDIIKKVGGGNQDWKSGGRKSRRKNNKNKTRRHRRKSVRRNRRR